MSNSPSEPCVEGDSTHPDTWQRMLEGQRADALVTDPPYCLLTRRRKGGAPRDPKDRKIERGPLRRFEDVRAYRDFTRAWLSLAVQHLDARAPLVIWTNLLGKQPIVEVAQALGYPHLRGEFVWGKRTREGNSGEELLRVVEVALVIARTPKSPATASAKALPWSAVAGYDDDGEALAFGDHPNHKPFGVLEPLLRTWTRPGERIVDCFAGSGSIPAAALRLGRRAACAEVEPDWAARVSARLQGVAGPLSSQEELETP